MVDGVGAGTSNFMQAPGDDGDGFQVSDDYHQKQGVSQFLAMINGANADMDEDGGDVGFQRLQNGMGVNENKKHLKKQTDMISQAEAAVALKGTGKSVKMTNMEMVDARGISEFYAELFAYSSAILGQATQNGDTYERFKLSIKFSFSILHSLSLQDVEFKRPIIPIVGESYEGHYI